MNIHEYQAKELLAKAGVGLARGAVAHSAEQAVYAATELGGWKWVVKAQVHAGARGKAGGIKMCKTYHEVRDAAQEMLGKRLVTHQTSDEGLPVQRVYVEVADAFEKEFYLGFVLDRKEERVRVLASKEGGMEIEQIAKDKPDSLITVIVEPAVGMQQFEAREIAFKLGLNSKQVQRAVQTILGCYRAFRDHDATMLEINPLVLTKDGRIIALDAKMSFDTNAMFRQRKVADMHDPAQEDPREAQAAEHNLNYVGLDGTIGCIVNGAGLAMATMDMIKHAGGEPANFLDVGGGASADRVATAFRLVMSDKNVNAVLVNIFAGINRCDWVAEGVVKAVKEIKPDIPIIVRLAGTNVEAGRKILEESGIKLHTAHSLKEAADVSVKVAKEHSKKAA